MCVDAKINNLGSCPWGCVGTWEMIHKRSGNGKQQLKVPVDCERIILRIDGFYKAYSGCFVTYWVGFPVLSFSFGLFCTPPGQSLCYFCPG